MMMMILMDNDDDNDDDDNNYNDNNNDNDDDHYHDVIHAMFQKLPGMIMQRECKIKLDKLKRDHR